MRLSMSCSCWCRQGIFILLGAPCPSCLFHSPATDGPSIGGFFKFSGLAASSDFLAERRRVRRTMVPYGHHLFLFHVNPHAVRSHHSIGIGMTLVTHGDSLPREVLV